MTTTASIYVRISHDPSGQELGIERQEDECRRFCVERGWAVGEVYRDNDRSATSGVVRPGFEALLKARPAVVVCWHSDRFVRLNKELERVIDLGLVVHAVHVGNLDLSTPSGRMVARLLTAVAGHEGEQKALRQKAANKQRASMGKPAWASRPPLGYTSTAEVVPEEAAAIRRAYDEVLAGRSMYAISNEWNANGPPARRGGRWTGVNLRRLLLAPRNAGIATYHGEEVGPGNWEPIVSEEVFRGVEALCKAEGRSGGNLGPSAGGRPSSSMLVGIASCGVCGAKARTQKARESVFYTCGGAGHFWAPAERVDGLVLSGVIDALNEEDVRRYWRDRAGDETERNAWLAQAAVLRGRMDEAAEGFAKGVITMAQLTTISSGVGVDLQEVEQRLAEWRPAYAASVLLADTEAMWQRMDDMSLPDLRQLVSEVCEWVVIRPRETKRTPFERRHLRVVIRGDAATGGGVSISGQR